eukprot:m.32584 g.32584  ORF g.32584 m.32584 type:complete len:351 (+) comp6392_c0_seq3:270-1322(+)
MTVCEEFRPQATRPTRCSVCFLHVDMHKNKGKSSSSLSFQLASSHKKFQDIVSAEQSTLQHKFECARRSEGTTRIEVQSLKEKRRSDAQAAKVEVKQVQDQLIKNKVMTAEERRLQRIESDRAILESVDARNNELIQRKKREEQAIQDKIEHEKAKAEAEMKEKLKLNLENEKVQKFILDMHEVQFPKRISSGMVRFIAAGVTLEDRQRLSHQHTRGKWIEEKTHFGSTIGQWVGCGCFSKDKTGWCGEFKGPVGEEDGDSLKIHLAEMKKFEKMVQQRVAEGMPEVVAKGKTKSDRKLLSHTLNMCPGLSKCKNKCKGMFEINSGLERWSCCGCCGTSTWCPSYTGPKL